MDYQNYLEIYDENHYCYCSESHFLEILQRQKDNPLPFAELIGIHAGCKWGCGSCIDGLKYFMMKNSLYFE